MAYETKDKPISWWWVALLVVLTVVGGVAATHYDLKFERHHDISVTKPPIMLNLPVDNSDTESMFDLQPASRPSYGPPVDVVHIGPYDYRISYRSNDQMPEYYGLVSKERGTILLNSSLREGELKRCCTSYSTPARFLITSVPRIVVKILLA